MLSPGLMGRGSLSAEGCGGVCRGVPARSRRAFRRVVDPFAAGVLAHRISMFRLLRARPDPRGRDRCGGRDQRVSRRHPVHRPGSGLVASASGIPVIALRAMMFSMEGR